MSTLNTSKAASAGVVLPHYAFSAVSFLFLTVLMFFSADSFVGHYFNPKLLAITHIATLGWGSMMIFGALYQFLPVILVSDLYSPSLAKWTLLLFVTGISILIYSFWNFNVGLPLQVGASIILAATTLFVFNIIATSLQVKEINPEAEFIITSCIWFWLTVVIGTLMSFNFTYVFLPKEHLYYLKIHAHIGIAGWFLLLIIGVSSRLIPMFLLSSSVSTRRLKYSFYVINGTLLSFFVDAIFFNGVSRGLIYFILIIIGMVFYFSFIFKVYKKRARKILDIGMKQSLIAIVILGIPISTGILINSDAISDPKFLLQMMLFYGVSIFLGFISMLVLGKTFKTLPFIVWLKLSKTKGKTKTPLPKDLYSETMVKWQFAFFVLGLILLLSGILLSVVLLIKAACILLIIAAVLYNINVFKLLFYKNKIN